jgi:hypothetical protein
MTNEPKNVAGGGKVRLVELLPNERVVDESWTVGATRWIAGINGKVFLTDQRLIFSPVIFLPGRSFACALSHIREVRLLTWNDWQWIAYRMWPGKSFRIKCGDSTRFFYLGGGKARDWARKLLSQAPAKRD